MTECYYRIVVNPEGCYSIWPIDVPIPAGWKSTGFTGAGEVALSQVTELWQLARSRLLRDGPNGPDDRPRGCDE